MVAWQDWVWKFKEIACDSSRERVIPDCKNPDSLICLSLSRLSSLPLKSCGNGIPVPLFRPFRTSVPPWLPAEWVMTDMAEVFQLQGPAGNPWSKSCWALPCEFKLFYHYFPTWAMRLTVFHLLVWKWGLISICNTSEDRRGSDILATWAQDQLAFYFILFTIQLQRWALESCNTKLNTQGKSK